MNSHDDWDDFTHTTQTAKIGSHELFDRYREFQRFIASLDRKELVQRRWLQTPEDDAPLATVFFDLPLAKQPTLFRKSAKANENLLGIWQARARAQAEYAYLAEGRPDFKGMTKDDLRTLARLSVAPDIVRELPAILSRFGVILVYVYALPGMGSDGAVFHLSTGHPVIALSLRFPRLDYFWFTLLHELAHLVLHNDQLKEPVYFDVEAEEKDKAEKAANRLAKDSSSNVSLGATASPSTTRATRASAVMPLKWAFIQRSLPVFSEKNPATTNVTAASLASTTFARSFSSDDHLLSFPESEDGRAHSDGGFVTGREGANLPLLRFSPQEKV